MIWKAVLLFGCVAGSAVVFCNEPSDADDNGFAVVISYAFAEADISDNANSKADITCRGLTPTYKCGPNQEFSNCTNGGCDARYCSQAGKPVPCVKLDPSSCKKGCVCISGYLQASNGTCVPRNQCNEGCGDDPNAHPGCGVNCGRTCSTYNKQSVACILICYENGCDCNAGYVYDPNVKKCVLPKDCTPTCGLNEVYSTCTNGGCSRRNCNQLDKPQVCVKRTPESCTKGCVCADGYLRNDNGTCVLESQCPQAGCGGDPNAQPGCGYNCRKKCSDYKVKINLCPRLQCKPDKCDCKDGFVFDDNLKKCVLPEQCTPICGLNEQYSSCTNGGCDLRNCSQVGSPQICINRTPESCIKGCICSDGYLRTSNGTCIPKDKCPATGCGGDPNAQPGCGYNCRKKCSDYKAKINLCPRIECKPDKCDCKDGFVYDDNLKKCVLPEKCTPTCGLNEVFSFCTNGYCGRRNCNELGGPIKCVDPIPGACTTGCVCADGYLRAGNGTCVPENQCPTIGCGGDRHAKPGCGVNCGKTCTTYKAKNPICPLICKVNGCDCIDGYVYDNNVKKCVLPEDCTSTCDNPNEVYDVCPAPCPPRRCDVDDRVIRCAAPPQPGDAACKPGCRCADGYARLANGTCVLREQCEQPLKCDYQANEIYDSCPATCPAQSCNVDPALVLCIIPNPEYGDPRCKPACRCLDGYVRNSANQCIPRDQCPQNQCKGQNEYLETCISGCSSQTCDSIGKIYNCPIQPAVCRVGCRCKPGYYRNDKNVCVPENECPQNQCKGQNEYLETCISGCSNQTCDSIGKIYNCPIQPAVCRVGCRCKPGYYRNDKNVCVPENECPSPPCPEGETYSRCPTVKCEGDYCQKTRDSPTSCPVGIVCDPPRCVCAFGRRRDHKTGKCIQTQDCPPFKCNGPNEEYKSCPATCPSDKCSDYVAGKGCPRFIIGIRVPCQPRCICKAGYYRNDGGICVPASQCGPKITTTKIPPVTIETTTVEPTYTTQISDQCEGQNEFFDTCISGCSNQTCETIGKVFHCPIQTTVCRTGCRCKPNFYRNGNNVCVPASQCPRTCGLNEVFSFCTNGYCGRRNCNELGGPIKCVDPIPGACTTGCVCADGYLRAGNGTCVPENQCPTIGCGGDRHAKPGCGVNCGKTCTTYKAKNPICPLICKVNGCDCIDGYVYDDNVNKCVLPEDCTSTCDNPNEVYDVCPAPCPPRRCDVDDRVIRCAAPPQPGDAACKPGCRCADGYARLANGTCVLREQCEQPLKCDYQANEIYDSCPATCPAQSCNVDPALVLCIPNPEYGDPRCKPACRCLDGYVRNSANQCIPRDQCPQNQCKGQNEYLETCISGCSSQTCDSIGKIYNCPIQPAVCRVGCRCKPGYYRNDKNVCVPENECPQNQCKGQNEYLETCISGCSNQTCDSIGKIYNCPIQPAVCRVGCRCTTGYYRNDKNVCVPENECPSPPCPEGETYSRCPTVKCEGDYCQKTRDSPNSCPVGIVCDPPRCVCAFGRRRDHKTGKCIQTQDCPPFKCDGPNEEYKSCPATCPSDKCSDYVAGKGCPRFIIGIRVPCQPRCICKTGYYRNDGGICVPAPQCGPKITRPPVTIETTTVEPTFTTQTSDQCQGQNEFFDTCISGCSNQTCETIGKVFHCPIQTTVCRTGCRCKPNFYRNGNNVCVPACQCQIGSTTTTTPIIETTITTDSSVNDGVGRLQAGVTNFNNKFLCERIKADKGNNLITSPYSVFTPLVQLALYSTGDSFKELSTVLNVQTKEQIRSAFPAYVASFDGQTSVNFSLAAKVYSNAQYPLSDAFKTDSIKVVHAGAQELDFSKNAEAADTINAWVESQTNNRIHDLILASDLSPSTRLVLVNAIYFKGEWRFAFNNTDTIKDADFYLSDGSTKKTDLMYQERAFNYGQVPELNCTVLEMFYKGDNFSMVVVLPNAKDGLISIAEKLQIQANFDKVMGSMTSQKVKVYLPPFKIETTTDLTAILQKLGVTKIFDPNNSGLSGMLKSPEQTYVSKAVQKAFIEVDEKGTEAAAANGVVVGLTAVFHPQPPEEFVFKCDHSFLFYIVCNDNVLFAGSVVDRD